MKPNYLILLSFVLAAAATSCTKTDIATSTQVSSADNSSAEVPSNTLIAWYTFDGDVLDHSAYGNNVDFNTATPVAGKNGVPNTAYYFDGSTTYMTVPNSTSLNPKHGITLAATIKVAAFYHGMYHANRILQKGYTDATSGNYFLGFDDYLSGNNTGDVADSLESFYGTYGNNQFNSIGTRDSSDLIKKNRWYTIVYTIDTNRIGRIYVNGTLKGTSTNASSDFTPNSYPLFIGRHQDPSYPYWFHGAIDEIKIYNRAYGTEAIQKITASMTN